MAAQSKNQSPLSASAMELLLAQKQQILSAAKNHHPDRLVRSTVQRVMRLAHNERPARVLAPRVLRLVRLTLRALNQKQFKIETALLLRKSPGLNGREGDGASR
jgi:hypothetical protein